MDLFIRPDGKVCSLYDETIDLSELGSLSITRASHVESELGGTWRADLSPIGGPRLTGFRGRGAALAAEQAWIEEFYFA